MPVLDTVARDVRSTVRALGQAPAFTFAAIATLALGIGANTAVFSVVNSILLRSLRYPHAGQLVSLDHAAPGAAGLASFKGGLPLSASLFFTYSDHNQTFQSLGVWAPRVSTVNGLAEPEHVRVLSLSEGVLETLGVPPKFGRWFLTSDQDTGAADTVLLSYGYWARHFGAAEQVVGRKLDIGGKPREVIGVMPEGFRIADAPADLYLPLKLDRRTAILAGFQFESVGRLKPGVSLEQANADLARLVPVWMNSWPFNPGGHTTGALAEKVYAPWRITPAIQPLQQHVVGQVSRILWVVMGTLGVVMLIACANVANFLLVRAQAREREYAVRAALGAGWRRIAGEMLTESLVLSFVGGAVGLGLAWGGLEWLRAIGPKDLPRLAEVSLDGRAFLFAFLAALGSGVLFGCAPVLRFARSTAATALRSGGRTASQGREQRRATGALVVVQVALAVVLLIAAGLMIRTFQSLRSVRPGFTAPETVQTFRVVIPPAMIPQGERVTRIENEILEKLAAIPGVESAGLASNVPLDGYPPDWDGILTEGKSWTGGDRPPMRVFRNVAPGFFQTMGTRLVAGRDLEWADVYGGRMYVMVSENLARELWGSAQGALGQRLRTTEVSPWREVAGVVEDVHATSMQEAAQPTVYWPISGPTPYPPFAIEATRAPVIVLRTSRAGTGPLLDQIRHAVWSVNAQLPMAEIGTMDTLTRQSMARTSFTLVMLAIAGGMALALGIVGIYGVLSYAVTQRQREVGIRMALGARTRQVKTMFLRRGLVLVGWGLGAGFACAWGLAPLMRALLYGVQPFDPWTYAVMPLLLAAAAMAACYLPARRAAQVDPAETLRAE